MVKIVQKLWPRLAVTVLMLSQTACITVDMGGLFDPELQERTVDGPRHASAKILVVDISGVIRSGSDRDLFDSYTTPSGIKKMLNKAEQDEAIKAVLLRINSPGGGVAASDLIYHEISAYKQRSGVPVYAVGLDVAASGGYYIAMAADEFYTVPTSIVGSIGVIARYPNLSGLADKVGYSETIFKSGDNKDLGHPLRTITPDQSQIFQALIDDMYGRFLDVIMAARPALSSREALAAIADGRVYTAATAQALELSDGLMYPDQLVEKIRADHGLPEPQVIIYRYGGGEDVNIYSRLNPEINILNMDVGELAGPKMSGLQYLWLPLGGAPPNG